MNQTQTPSSDRFSFNNGWSKVSNIGRQIITTDTVEAIGKFKELLKSFYSAMKNSQSIQTIKLIMQEVIQFLEEKLETMKNKLDDYSTKFFRHLLIVLALFFFTGKIGGNKSKHRSIRRKIKKHNKSRRRY